MPVMIVTAIIEIEGDLILHIPLEEGGGTSDHPTLGPGGGGGEQIQITTVPTAVRCGAASSAAQEIANSIKATDDPGSDAPYSWQQAEYTAWVSEHGSQFGAFDDHIRTRGALTNSGIQALSSAGPVVHGFVHNHPDAIGDGYEDNNQRYPSGADWAALDYLFGVFGSSVPNFDPTVWVLAPDGVTRGFKRSERAAVESLSAAQRQQGVGLAGRSSFPAC